jgi:hypothetical protein
LILQHRCFGGPLGKYNLNIFVSVLFRFNFDLDAKNGSLSHIDEQLRVRECTWLEAPNLGILSLKLTSTNVGKIGAKNTEGSRSLVDGSNDAGLFLSTEPQLSQIRQK